MANQHPSPIPANPYVWHESVLSTRSLSYMSTADALASGQLPSPLVHAINPASIPPPPSTAMDEDSEPELEMAGRAMRSPARKEQVMLPDSVARSRLFTLPREIRDRIYSFCLVAPYRQVIEWPAPSPWRLNLSTELLRTCKIIFNEAAPIAYVHNEVAFSHPSDANVFVRAIASRQYARYLAYIHLHARAQDTRLWIPYLSSSDRSRNLKDDFPNMRELTVRYKSNKWQHSLPIDSNMRHWSEDRHLDEVIDILRNVFWPPAPKHVEVEAREAEDREIFRSLLRTDPESPPPDNRDKLREKTNETWQQKEASTWQRSRGPLVKVVCACRVHHTHFAALTNTLPLALPLTPPLGAQQNHDLFGGLPSLLNQHTNALLLPQMIQPHPAAPAPPTAGPVQEGEDFRGFTASDLRGRVRRVTEGDGNSSGSSALVARTVFANKKSILLALEILSVE